MRVMHYGKPDFHTIPCLVIIVTILLSTLVISCSSGKLSSKDTPGEHPDSTVSVKLLAINDFHGQINFSIETPLGRAGGAAVLDAYLRNAASKNSNTFFISAGDLTGASALTSAILKDEPAVQFFSRFGNNSCGCTPNARFSNSCNLIAIPGNHEFDAGLEEYLRLINGGNHEEGPFLEKEWTGSRFPVIACNVRRKSDNELVFPPYIIKSVNGAKIAFIGATLVSTPHIVKNPTMLRLQFTNEADAINSFIPEIKSKGIHAIVAIIHNGGLQNTYEGQTDSTRSTLSGPILSILDKLNDDIDIAITSHSHSFTNTYYHKGNSKTILVTQGGRAGTAFADIDIVIQKSTGEITKKTAAILPALENKGPAVVLNKQTVEFTKYVSARASLKSNKKIGDAEHAIIKSTNEAGESALGNLFADAQRTMMGSDFSFVNTNMLRGNLSAGPITWSKLYYIQPNNNKLVKITLSGQQIVDLLNQQWQNRTRPCFLQVSGLTYSWNESSDSYSHVIDVFKDGVSIDRNADYTVTVPSFLADGGENFTVFLNGKKRIEGPMDLDVLEAYLLGYSKPLINHLQNRITKFSIPQLS